MSGNYKITITATVENDEGTESTTRTGVLRIGGNLRYNTINIDVQDVAVKAAAAALAAARVLEAPRD